MRSAGEGLEHPLGVGRVGGLAEDRASERNGGVDGDDKPLARLPGHRARLAERVLAHEVGSVGARQVVLLVVRRDDVERQSELLEDRATLWARGGEEERRRGRAHGLNLPTRPQICGYTRSVVSGDLLREARLRAGLSQAELARRAGKARSAIGRWERGEVLPSFETLRELVRACGLRARLRALQVRRPRCRARP